MVLIGEAEVLDAPVSSDEMTVYLKKYKLGLEGINMTEDEFQDSYHIAIRIKPIQLRGH